MVQRQMGPGMIVQQEERVASKEKCKTEDTALKVTRNTHGHKFGSSLAHTYELSVAPTSIFQPNLTHTYHGSQDHDREGYGRWVSD